MIVIQAIISKHNRGTRLTKMESIYKFMNYYLRPLQTAIEHSSQGRKNRPFLRAYFDENNSANSENEEVFVSNLYF